MRQQGPVVAGQYVPNFIWTNTAVDGNYRPRDIPFIGVEGLRNPMPQDAEPIDYFQLYFTDAIVDIICRETNRYAQQYIVANEANLRPKSIVHDWTPTNANEMKAFLGLCVLMGVIHKPRVSMYWSTDSFYHTPLFGQVMSRKRFQLLQRFLHFQDNQDPAYNPDDPDRDRLYKVRTVINMMRERFNTIYYPPENLSIDESLVLYKGRLLFKQYIKTKRSRFGIKMFELATSNGILLDFMIYQGNIEPTLIQPPGENWLQTERIPLTMMEPYLDRGHTLTIDNWYTTTRLAKYLLQHSTKVVGTIRSNRKHFPKDFPEDKDIQKGTAIFKESGNILAMKYRGAKDKSPGKPKIVHVISTKHGAKMMNTNSKDADGNIIKKPEAIVYYNHNMGGIDRMDQQLHGIQVLRKTYKWYQKIFFRLMMLALLSSQKLYKSRGGKLEFLHYIHEIVRSLVEGAPNLKNKPRIPSDNLLRLTGRHFPAQVAYKGSATKKSHAYKRCRVCYARKITTPSGHPIKSVWQCPDCPGEPGLCPGDCFKKFHTKFNFAN